MNDANDMSSGEEAGKAAGKRTPEGRRFSGEYAREMGRRGAQKRLAQAAGAADADADSILVTVPVSQVSVIQGLLLAASKGSAPAAPTCVAGRAPYPGGRRCQARGSPT